MSYVQLPAVTELKKIMEKEAWRDPAKGKENKHYPDFKLAVEWMKLIGLDDQIFCSNFPWEEVLGRGLELGKSVVEKTLGASDEDIYKRIVEYLGDADEPRKADLIFVFGSKSPLRMEKAIELWGRGMATKIFVTGGHPNYESGPAEAEVYRQLAVGRGVPEDAIIIEPQSITIADNVRRSLNLFEEIGLEYGRMILVTNWFAMRRSWAFMMKYIPAEYKLYRVISEVKEGGDFDPKLWWKNPNGIRVVFNEFVKMKTGVALNTC